MLTVKNKREIRENRNLTHAIITRYETRIKLDISEVCFMAYDINSWPLSKHPRLQVARLYLELRFRIPHILVVSIK